MHEFEVYKEHDNEYFCKNGQNTIDNVPATMSIGHEHTIIQQCKYCGKIKIIRYTA